MCLSLDSLRLSVREVSTEREREAGNRDRERETGNISWTWEVVSQSGLAKVVCQRGGYREGEGGGEK